MLTYASKSRSNNSDRGSTKHEISRSPQEIADEVLEFSKDMKQIAKTLKRRIREGKLQKPTYPLVIDWQAIEQQS